MLVVVLGLIGYPFLLSLYYSLTDKVIAEPNFNFVGLKNYVMQSPFLELSEQPVWLTSPQAACMHWQDVVCVCVCWAPTRAHTNHTPITHGDREEAAETHPKSVVGG